jgi:hypothetical protein
MVLPPAPHLLALRLLHGHLVMHPLQRPLVARHAPRMQLLPAAQQRLKGGRLSVAAGGGAGSRGLAACLEQLLALFGDVQQLQLACQGGCVLRLQASRRIQRWSGGARL